MNDTNVDLIPDPKPLKISIENKSEPPEINIIKNSNKRFTFETTRQYETEVASMQGSEVIIYEQPIEIPDDTNFHIMIYLFIQFGSELLYKAILGVLIIIAYHKTPFSIFGIIVSLLCFQIWRILFNTYYLIKYGDRTPAFNSVYLIDILLSLGYLIIFSGFIAVLQGKLNPSTLPILVVPHILLTFTRLAIGEVVNTPYLPGSLFCFFESFQLLYMALKFASPGYYPNWTWVLLFYYIVAVAYFILAIVFMIVLLIFLLSFALNSEIFREFSNLLKFLIVGVLFYFVWNGIAFYYILSEFDFLLQAKTIALKPRGLSPNPRLLQISWFIIICALLTFVLLMIAYFYLKESLLKFLNKDKPKEISLQSFVKNLELNVKQVSGNYFKSGNKRNDTNSFIKSTEPIVLDTCLICFNNKSDVMFHPCKHSGMCQDCLKQYLRDKDICPHCREKIERAYLIFYDETKKKYM